MNLAIGMFYVIGNDYVTLIVSAPACPAWGAGLSLTI